jgi:hypothetical protein
VDTIEIYLNNGQLAYREAGAATDVRNAHTNPNKPISWTCSVPSATAFVVHFKTTTPVDKSTYCAEANERIQCRVRQNAPVGSFHGYTVVVFLGGGQYLVDDPQVIID